MLILYNILLTLLFPIWVPWMWLRTIKRKEQPNWKERFGDYNLEPRRDKKRVWVHAVSVGEVVAATPILKEIRTQLPDHEIILTTTTSSGQQTARDTAQGLYDHLFYFPIDVNRFMGAAMQRVQPAVIAVMETELWPNFLWWAKVFDTRTLLINGRISDRSFKRSKAFKPLYRSMLKNVDRCLMQTDADATRIKELGAQNAEVLGNAKFDQAAKVVLADSAAIKQELGFDANIPVVVIGSTRGEEEERFVIDALKRLEQKINVIHAPRHIERTPELVSLLQQNGIQPEVRSQLVKGTPNEQSASKNAATPQRRNAELGYLILDTYGELDRMYAAADVVVIGGGFANLGGQNLIQPLAQGKPVIHGPHMQNFREAAHQANETGAAICVQTPEELAKAINILLSDRIKKEQMGSAARKLVQANLGASRRYAEAIAQEAVKFHNAK